MSSRRRRTWGLALGGVAVACALAACTVSLPGGVIGGLLALLLAGGLLFGAGAAQSGCDSGTTQACLSVTACLSPPKADGAIDSFTACLSVDAARGDAGADLYVGPCLEPPLPDGALDGPLGPCLDPPAPDGALDGPVGPCLSPLPPDAGADMPIGPCLSVIAPDAGSDAAVGPCLSPPAHPWDAGQAAALPGAAAPAAAADAVRHGERDALLAALADEGRLPADVVARLKDRSGQS